MDVINDKLIDFLKRYKEHLRSGDIEGLYSKAIDKLDAVSIGNFTELLISSGIDIYSYLTYIPREAFCRTNITEIDLPPSIESIKYNAFAECKNLKEIVMRGVHIIGEYAFYNCVSLKDVKFSPLLKEIKTGVFLGCESLETIFLPDSLNVLGNDVFSGCTNLKNVRLGNNLTTIGGFAFDQCEALQVIDIPDSVKVLGRDAFDNCTSLSKVTIGVGLRELRPALFAYCDKLTEINYRGTKADWDYLRKANDWAYLSKVNKIVCADGDINL